MGKKRVERHIMEFTNPLSQAVLLKRYKRYLAEVVLNNQEHRVIQCPNYGAMVGCEMLGSRIWFSSTGDSQRRYPDVWELVEVDNGCLVCVNTQRALPLLLEAIENHKIPTFESYVPLQISPVMEEFQLDLLLEKENATQKDSVDEKCLVGIHTVTLGDEIKRGFFPDAPTELGVQRLRALVQAKALGYRAVLVLCSLHDGISRLFPADHIDSQFGCLIRQAIIAGVEVVGCGVNISPDRMQMHSNVEVHVPARLISSYRSEKSR